MVCPLDGGPDIAQARRWICSRYTWRLSVPWRSSGWCFRWFMTVGPNDWYLFIMILLKSEIQRQGSEIWVFINWIWFRFLSKAWFSRGRMGPFRGSSHLCARRHQKVLHHSSDVKHGPHQNTAIDTPANGESRLVFQLPTSPRKWVRYSEHPNKHTQKIHFKTMKWYGKCNATEFLVICSKAWPKPALGTTTYFLPRPAHIPGPSFFCNLWQSRPWHAASPIFSNEKKECSRARLDCRKVLLGCDIFHLYTFPVFVATKQFLRQSMATVLLKRWPWTGDS